MEENNHVKEELHSADAPAASETSTGPAASERKQIKISIKTASIIAGVVIVLALLFSYRGMFIAATVNGSPISRLALIHQLEKSAGKGTLDMMVVQKLIDLEAKKNGITVTREEIDAQIKIIEDQIAAQGAATLAEMLVSRGMTQRDLEKQITTQQQVEKLIADKTAVTDQEVDQFISSQKITLKADEEAEVRTQIAAQLKQEKVNTEGNALVESLRKDAKVSYFVDFAMPN
jgi:hypothetical protein